MLSYYQSSIYLLLIWGVSFLLLRKKLITSKGYFLLLFIMAIAGLLLPLDYLLNIDYTPIFKVENILLFAILLVTAIIPWLLFDVYYCHISSMSINPNFICILRIVCVVLLLLSFYAIIYCMPYAIKAYEMGSSVVRTQLTDESILPSTFQTTIAVAAGIIAPVYILLFFLSLISNKLKLFSWPLFIGSLTYLVTSAPSQARDGFILIPATYYFLYKIFKPFLSEKSLRKLKRFSMITIPFGVFFWGQLTLGRFYEGNFEESFDRLIAGTWGYFYQQPFVFDQTIQHQTFFHGISYRFPLIGELMGLPPVTERIINEKFEFMFGTMYASFYSATGWNSLIVASLFFALSWTLVFFIHNKFGNFMGMLLVFSIYLYYLISGLFYLRFSAVSITITFLVLIGLSFFLKRIIIVKTE